MEDDPDCRLCGLSQEIAYHLLSDCSILGVIRSNVLGPLDANVTPDIKNHTHLQKGLRIAYKSLKSFWYIKMDYFFNTFP